jgi:hypothetical protein
MSATSERRRIDDAIVRAGEVDYLDVWFIAGLAADVAGTADRNEAAIFALEAIHRLLQSGMLRAGELTPPGEFIPWSEQDPAHVYRQVRHRWEALNRPLAVGDVAWFRVERRERP